MIKRFSIQSTLTLFFIVGIRVTFFCQAPTPTCATPYNGPSSPPTTISDGTNCIQFLNDFVPNSTDPILEINVNFWVLAPSTNSLSGAWTYSNSTHGNHITTQADAQNCLDVANTTFSNIPAPTLNISEC